MTQATGNVPPGRAGRNLGAVALAALCVVAAAGLYLYENHGQLYPRTSAPGTTVAGASAPSATALGASASGNAKPGA
ncbi:MAG TPA: hypothetical protein VHX12_09955, partial [Acidisoma sp.]|nr:hypothetical protein [Acidisoma sp.]